jgi:RNA polymerase sporulation-specific sigma factor
MIEGNIGLVHACASRFKGRGIEYDDLFSAGCIGLCKAADAFEPERGFRFSTYAVPVILGEVRRLFREGGAVSVSRGVKELSMRINRERDAYRQLHGHEPQLSEIALAVGADVEKVTQAIAVSAPPVSLTAQEDGAQIDVPVESPEYALSDTLALRQCLTQLSDNDRALVVMRYFKGMTQSAVAEALSMTQVQVSRREKKILAWLRERLI